MADAGVDPNDLLKKDNIEHIISKEQVYGRMQLLTQECAKLKHTLQRTKDQKDKEKLNADTLYHDLKVQKDNLQIELTNVNMKVNSLEKKLEQLELDKNAEIDRLKNTFEQDKSAMQKHIEEMVQNQAEMEQFKSEKEKLVGHIKSLQDDFENERKTRLEQVMEKEREKIQATEKLRKEMLFQIKKTKANLLALNDEQLQTTTRLTILQNHQLTTELEYQSKQTEDLLYKNNKMKTSIETLKREIEIHKEVEKELAKRSHFCQKVIKRLRNEVAELKQEKEERPRTHPHTNHHSGSKTMRGHAQTNNMTEATRNAMADELKSSEELITFLESKLEQHEKNLQQK